MAAVPVLGRLAGTVVIDVEWRLIETTRKPARITEVDAQSIKVLHAKAIDYRETANRGSKTLRNVPDVAPGRLRGQ
jgi:ethanolamine utilization protein EutA (predicted chaperonin)